MPLQVLIAQGEADAYHASSSSGRTALMEAAAIGKCPCIQALVEEGGSDVNMANELRDGGHPLLVAAAAGGWHSTAGGDSTWRFCHGSSNVCFHLQGVLIDPTYCSFPCWMFALPGFSRGTDLHT